MPNININGRVSVVFFCYNTDKFIARSIQSTIDQDYDDLEIICVFDGTTDSSEDIARNILSKCSRRYYIYHTNGPSGYTPMTIDYPSSSGVLRSTGEYVAIQAADNISLPHKISSLVKAIEGYPMSYASRYREFYNEDDGNIGNVRDIGDLNDRLLEYTSSNGTRSRVRISTESMLFRKDTYMMSRFYIPCEVGGWDSETAHMVGSYSVGNLGVVHDVLTHFRVFTPNYWEDYNNLLLDKSNRMSEKMASNGYEMDDIFDGKYKYIHKMLPMYFHLANRRNHGRET